MASRALVNASSKVSPAEKQPGKSGTTTPYACLASPVSIDIGSCINYNLILDRPAFESPAPPLSQILLRMRNRNGARVALVHPVHEAAASRLPAIRLQELDQLA